jgi:hypothetical protein
VLVECHEILVTSLWPVVGSLSDKCYSNMLVTRDTVVNIQKPCLTEQDKVRTILLNLEQTIEHEPKKHEVFIKILKEFPSCEHLVEKLVVCKLRHQVCICMVSPALPQ